MSELGIPTIIWCALVLVLAGVIKGIIGIGLPLVSIPLLALAMPVPQAVSLMPIPILLSNIWQAFHGGHFSRALRRFWPLLLTMCAGTVVGVKILSAVDARALYVVVGVVVVLFSLTSYLQPQLRVHARAERWLGPIVGLIGGVLGGLSTIYGPPLIMFLVALHLHKNEFVGTIATFYLIGIIPLIAALGAFDIMGRTELLASTLVTVPLFIGMTIGQLLRTRVSQERFHHALLVVLSLLGCGLGLRALWV